MTGSVWAERLRPPVFGFSRVGLVFVASYSLFALLGPWHAAEPLLVLGYWRGEFWTSWLGRSLVTAWRNWRIDRAQTSQDPAEPPLPATTQEDPEAATVVLRVARADHEVSAVDASRTGVVSRDRLPLDVVFGYLDKYGVRAERVSVLTRAVRPEPSLSRDYYSRLVPASALSSRTTWVTLTFTAAGCASALHARFGAATARGLASLASATASRLAAQMRGHGWEASVVSEDEVASAAPSWLGKSTWSGVRDRRGGWWSAHALDPRRCPEALAAVEGADLFETWLSLSASPGGASSAWLAVRSSSAPRDRLFAGTRPLSGRHAAAVSSLRFGASNDLPWAQSAAVGAVPALTAEPLEWASGPYGAPVGVTPRGSVALASLSGFSDTSSVGIVGDDRFVSSMTARALLTVRSAAVLTARPERWRRVADAAGGLLRVNDLAGGVEMIVLDGVEAPAGGAHRLVVTVGQKLSARHDVVMVQHENDRGRFELRAGGKTFDLAMDLAVKSK